MTYEGTAINWGTHEAEEITAGIPIVKNLPPLGGIVTLNFPNVHGRFLLLSIEKMWHENSTFTNDGPEVPGWIYELKLRRELKPL